MKINIACFVVILCLSLMNSSFILASSDGKVNLSDDWYLKRLNMRQNLVLNPPPFRRNIVAGYRNHVFVVSSGIDSSHPDLRNYIAPDNQHFDFVNEDGCKNINVNSALCDLNGRGTNLAGLIGSNVYGYNQSIILHSIKTFNKSKVSVVEFGSIVNKVIEIKNDNFPNEITFILLPIFNLYDESYLYDLQLLRDNDIIAVIGAGGYCFNDQSLSKNLLIIGSLDNYDRKAKISSCDKTVNYYLPGINIKTTSLDKKYEIIEGIDASAAIFTGVFSAYLGKQPSQNLLDFKKVLKNFEKFHTFYVGDSQRFNRIVSDVAGN